MFELKMIPHALKTYSVTTSAGMWRFLSPGVLCSSSKTCDLEGVEPRKPDLQAGPDGLRGVDDEWQDADNKLCMKDICADEHGMVKALHNGLGVGLVDDHLPCSTGDQYQCLISLC